jgi:hypothetical protein
MISTKILSQACMPQGPVPYAEEEAQPKMQSQRDVERPLEEEEEEEEVVRAPRRREKVIKTPRQQEKVSEPVKQPIEEKPRCPCTVVDSKTREKKICGAPVKQNGVCGRHKNKCNLPVPPLAPEPERKKPASPKPKPVFELERKKPASPNLSEAEKKMFRDSEEAKLNGRCPCIVTKKNGEKTICGNKAKFDGHCGIHKKKCNLPDAVELSPAEEEKEITPDEPSVIPVQLPQKREIIAEVSEIKKVGTCPCILTSKRKPGEPAQVCGRKIKADGRCGIHQKKCELPEEAPIVPLIKEPIEEEPNVELDELAAQIEEELEEEPNVELDELAAQIEEGLEGEEELAAQIEEGLEGEEELAAQIEEELNEPEEVELKAELDAEWPIINVASMEDVIQYVRQLDRKPRYDVFGLAAIDAKIQECLNL